MASFYIINSTPTSSFNPKLKLILFFSPLKTTFCNNRSINNNNHHHHLFYRSAINPPKLNASLGDNLPDNSGNFLDISSAAAALHLGLDETLVSRFQRVSEELSDNKKLGGFVIIAGLAWLYLTARPGVLVGAIDAYIFAPLQIILDSLIGRRSLKRTDFLVGERIGEGSFGVVYSGVRFPKDLPPEERVPGRGRRKSRRFDDRFKDRVILKKVKAGVTGAEEFGEYEGWFNYRLSRAAPETCAEFLGSFVADQTNSEFTKGGKWLVWKFEGDRTLGNYINDRNFPLNLESVMFGRVLQGEESEKRNALTIKQIMRQIITSLKKIHDTGIVHRDMKPSNLVVTKKWQIKLIDFGAATDLRIGKNYIPNRALLDPDFCPPELYVLPEETPIPPPEPIAALLSPILWQLNSPGSV